MIELAFAWLLSQHVVTSVIAGATTPKQVTQNAAAVGARFSVTDLEQLDLLLRAG